MERNEELNLVDAIAVLRRRWWVVLAFASFLGVLSFAYFRQQTPQYHASSVLLIDVRTASRISAAAGQTPTYTDPDRILADQVQFANSQSVRGEVANRIGGAINVAVKGDKDADVLTIEATDFSPIRAAQIANTYAQVHQEFTAQQAQAAYDEALAGIDAVLVPIQTRLAELAPVTNPAILAPSSPAGQAVDPTLLAERRRLETELASLETKKNGVRVSAGIDKDVVTKVITEASVPGAPFSPQPKRNAMLGMLAGLVLGLAGVFLADYLDDRLRDKASIVKAVPNVPALALIPRDPRAARAQGSLAAEGGAVGEAIRGLRTGVQFAGLSQHLHSVMLTSSRPKEGKSTVATSLAVALATSGTPTVLIDADLRKPRAHKVLGIEDNSLGLSSVLQGRAALGQVVRNAPGVENLLFVPAGPIPENAADLLSSGLMLPGRMSIKTIIDELTDKGYLVVIDAPPVLPVADALTIARVVDGVVYVLAAGQARERDVSRAFELLHQAGANVIGMAVNKLSRSSGGYGYGYGYGYGDGGGRRSSGAGSAASVAAPVEVLGVPAGTVPAGPAAGDAGTRTALNLVDLRAAVGAEQPQPPAGNGQSGLHNPLSGNGSV